MPPRASRAHRRASALAVRVLKPECVERLARGILDNLSGPRQMPLHRLDERPRMPDSRTELILVAVERAAPFPHCVLILEVYAGL